MIDTHAHLDACTRSPSELLERAQATGVQRVVTIGTGIESSRAALELCARNEGVYAALGIHPHDAGEASPEALGALRRLLDDPNAVAVGETGLDYYRDYAPRERQATVFRQQAELAAELGKALVVHTRAATEDTLAILAEVDPPTVILHCCSDPALVPVARERGYYVSFAGNVTYPKAASLRLAAAEVPSDRLLAETDSPFLAPQPVRGKENEPANVRHVMAVLAGARGVEPGALERIVDENASRAFGLP